MMEPNQQGENVSSEHSTSFSVPSIIMRSLIKINRKYPHLSRLFTNFSLITCFAVCLCAASYTFHLVDEILEASANEPHIQAKDVESPSSRVFNRPNIIDLKAILEQRGIPVDTMLERKELDAAIESTGTISTEELIAVKSTRRKMEAINVTTSADACTFRNLVQYDGIRPDQNYPIESSNTHSIVFDSESEFIERVEDNKDSVWLLAVVSSNLRSDVRNARSILTDEVWATLVHRYIQFGFKLGLLNCQKLRGICIDRGFIAADLILALPRGGDRMKDLVQFRPYPKQSDLNVHSSTASTIKNIHNWVVSILSERLRSLQSVDDILPASLSFLTSGKNQPSNFFLPHWSWLSKRTQPINILWLPKGLTSNELLLQKSSLILSALSVPYTGRARFWVVHPSLLSKKSGKPSTQSSLPNWALSDTSIQTIPELLTYLRCPKDSRFLILTPEAMCYGFAHHRGEFFSYNALELCLQFLFPSANDFFCISFVLLNLVLLINSAFLIAQTILVVIHNSNESLILQSELSRSKRFGLANTVIRMVRQGWTSHVPNFWQSPSEMSTNYLDSHSTREQFLSPTSVGIQNSTSLVHVSKFSFIGGKIWTCFKTLLVDFISANLLLLLMILPLINLLSLPLSTPFINLFLWFMRSVTLTQPIIAMRLAISSGHMTPVRLLSVGFVLWFGLVLSSMYIYSVVYGTDNMLTYHTYSRRSGSRRRHRLHPSVILERLNQSSPDQFWNELASFLLMSDKETKSDPTSATTSSTTESDTAANAAAVAVVKESLACSSSNKRALSSFRTPDNSQNPEFVEGSRLLRRLCRLHRILSRQSDQLACVPPPPPPPQSSSADNGFDLYPRYDSVGNQSSRQTATTAAHMYTWQCSFSSKLSASPTNLNDKPLVRERFERSRRKVNTPNLPMNDLCYEAEDERDVSSEDDHDAGDMGHSTLRSLSRVTSSIRPNKNSYSSSDPSSDDDVADSAGEPITNENIDPPNQSLVDVPQSMNPLDWPTWVVPCDACVVCWRKFRSGVRLSALPCGHGFHELCIRRWLDTGALDCPVCRWPAYAPHLRQQCQMIGQLIEAVQAALSQSTKETNWAINTSGLSEEQSLVE